MERPFPPFDPEGPEGNAKRRLRDIPLRAIFPTMLTLLAICMGLTSIRFSVEARYDLAVGAIILAAILDGIDGRVARFLKSTSRFGAQMDSLADFVNFGVAPAMLLYFGVTAQWGPPAWIGVLVYAICTCLRLARFNAMLDEPGRPVWHGNYFVGVPAPAGALTVLVPAYLIQLGLPRTDTLEIFTIAYTIAIGLLMVSSLPTWSGKEFSRRIPRDYAMPLLLAIVVLVAVLVTYPWVTLTVSSLLYLACIPFSWRAWHRRHASERANGRK